MRIVFSVFLVALLTARLPSSETTGLSATVKPAAVGLDAAKLAGIDKLMSSEVEAGRIVGCLALVARGDKVAYVKTWGDRDREDSKPMTEDTIFRIYSMSKPITSVAAMQLVERGKMNLDDALSNYLPALKNVQVLTKEGDETKEVPAERPISVRDLLRHTSGFTYGFFGDTKVDQRYRRAGILSEATIEETVTKLGDLPLLHQPGSRWHYSVSTDVLGRLVEVVSGQRFDKYLQQHIFDPLDMVDTFFMVPAEKKNRFAEMYSPDGEDALKLAASRRSRRFVDAQNRFFSGGGGLCSTTRDYLRFCQALLRGGELDGNRVVKTETINEMTKNQLQQITSRSGGFQFGLGFRISPEGEYSWGGAAGTRFWINPKRNLIGIYMIQINPYRSKEYGNEMKKIVYAADTQASAENAPTASTP